MSIDELPLGFGMALAQEPDALSAFGKLSETQKSDVIQKAHSVNSKDEMHSLVRSLVSG